MPARRGSSRGREESTMVVEEFEGKTEEEAIEQAIQKLGLRREDIDVEIVESRRPGLFRSGNVRIRVHVGDEIEIQDDGRDDGGPADDEDEEARPPIATGP